MSDKTYIGVRASRLESGETLKPYTGVIVNFEDASGEIQSYTAGTVSGENVGSVLEVEFPWATQAIADSLLARVQGYAYTPFKAKDARLDPAAELGDGVTVGGIYSVLASRTSVAVAIEADEIGADYDEEINHEFRYESKIERSIRTLNKASTSLRVSVDEIIGEVTDGAGNYTVLTMNAQGLIVESNRGEIEINGGQLKAGTVIADSIVADSLIQSPTIYGAEYLSARGTTKLELAEVTPSGETDDLPALIWSTVGTNAHQNILIYDIGGFALRFDAYQETIATFWSGTHFPHSSLSVNAALELVGGIIAGTGSRGTDEPFEAGLDIGQLYFQQVGESVNGWYPAQVWIYGG